MTKGSKTPKISPRIRLIKKKETPNRYSPIANEIWSYRTVMNLNKVANGLGGGV